VVPANPSIRLTYAIVAVFPLAFYSSMRMAGVAARTVVSIGSAALAAALIETSARPSSPHPALGVRCGGQACSW
jgi:drug/metabolite transporter, DME family